MKRGRTWRTVRKNSLWGWRSLKGIGIIFLDSLLYYCFWVWYIIPLFALPMIPYFAWLGFEIIRLRTTREGIIGKIDRGGSIGFWTWIISYGFIFLVVWLCSTSITPEILTGIQLPEISISFPSNPSPGT